MASIEFRGLQKISAETIAMLDPVFLLRSVARTRLRVGLASTPKRSLVERFCS